MILAVSTDGASTSTVIVRTPFTVLPDTLAAPLPTNFTSLEFFTTSLYSPFASVALSDETTQPIFCRSPTVAAAFLFTGAASVPTKSTSLGLSASTVGVPFVLVSTGFTFRVEPTPVIWVGLPSEEETFNAVVGLFAGSLLEASVAFTVVKLTGFLPSLSSPTFTEVNSTSSFIE